MSKRILLGVLLMAAMAAPAIADATRKTNYPIVVGEAGVTDGDTIRMAEADVTVDGKTEKMTKLKIRFFGIDTPEKGQPCWDSKGREYNCTQAATNAMANIVKGKVVTCSIRDIDRYGRLVGVCSVPGIPDINAEMVRRGLAVAYREYSIDYADDELAARDAGVGLWAGKFDMPWEWRAAQKKKP